MRCSMTNQFASFDDAEAEVYYEDLSGRDLNVTVRVYRACADCGSEAAEYTFDLEETVPDCSECLAAATVDEDEDDEFELVSVDVEVTDRHQTHDRNGKPIKSFRYQKHLIGAIATATVRCPAGHEQELSFGDEAAASEFEDTEH